MEQTVIRISGSTADIDFPHKNISGNFLTSPNGEYYFLSDTLYSEQNDTAQESVIVFTRENVVYMKSLGDDGISDKSLCRIFDDGSCAYLTDEGKFVVLGMDGKQIARYTVPDVNCAEYSGSTFWIFGSNDDSNGVLFVFDFGTMKGAKKIIPDKTVIAKDEDGEDDEMELCAADADAIFTGERFVLGYDDGNTCVAFDINLKPSEPTAEDIEAVFAQQRARLKKEEEDRERRRAERAAYLSKKQQAAEQQTEESQFMEHKIDAPNIHQKEEPHKKNRGFFDRLFHRN